MEDKRKIAQMLVLGFKPKMGGLGDKSNRDSLEQRLKDTEESNNDDSPMDESGTDESDIMTAGKEVMDCLKTGDTEGFVESLKSFIELCDYPEEDSEESKPEGM